jgi:Uma2 family endonuclease
MSQVATRSREAIRDPLPVPDAETLYEIVDGQRVEKAPMGTFEVFIAAILDQLLGAFVRSNRLGRVFPEMLFRINALGSPQRRPDVAFVSYSRWPRDRKVDSANGWDVVPELAVEVISPSDPAIAVVEKIHEYFQAGVLRVWVVYPNVRQVYVYEGPARVQILDVDRELDGGDILPGFRLSLAELFEDGAED